MNETGYANRAFFDSVDETIAPDDELPQAWHLDFSNPRAALRQSTQRPSGLLDLLQEGRRRSRRLLDEVL